VFVLPTVKVAVPELTIVVGEILQAVKPAEQVGDNVTVPVKPLIGVTVKVEVAVAPPVTMLRVVGEAENAKSTTFTTIWPIFA
jgi:hypothetical protein